MAAGAAALRFSVDHFWNHYMAEERLHPDDIPTGVAAIAAVVPGLALLMVEAMALSLDEPAVPPLDPMSFSLGDALSAPDGTDLPGAASFIIWLERIRLTADFDNPRTHDALLRQIDEVIQAMHDHPALRETCIAVALQSTGVDEFAAANGLKLMQKAMAGAA